MDLDQWIAFKSCAGGSKMAVCWAFPAKVRTLPPPLVHAERNPRAIPQKTVRTTAAAPTLLRPTLSNKRLIVQAEYPVARMIVHLVDGTYELFRHYYGLKRAPEDSRRPFSAAAGVLHTVLEMIEKGATHVGVATDHVIESFRNRLWPGYKTGEGVERELLAQFHPLEEALTAMGVAVFPMVELEADDPLASAARIAAADPRVEKVCILTPDKDLAQCVRANRVVQADRRTNRIRDEAGVREKFGVDPIRIPDYLALVGDAADGYPGLAGIGPVGAARLINRHGGIEDFPEEVIGERRGLALLF